MENSGPENFIFRHACSTLKKKYFNLYINFLIHLFFISKLINMESLPPELQDMYPSSFFYISRSCISLSPMSLFRISLVCSSSLCPSVCYSYVPPPYILPPYVPSPYILFLYYLSPLCPSSVHVHISLSRTSLPRMSLFCMSPPPTPPPPTF